MMNRFEEGSLLSKQCRGKLSELEKKIEILAQFEGKIKEQELFYFHFKESSRDDETCERGWILVINNSYKKEVNNE